ncbi:MAG: SDR family NAD(P)-dependent oxidoreductase [Chlamydiota bacterium]|nr:SDR family NAD(P)-dependent oxidoreductase [Chlamydiota bacterium]
MKKVIIVGASSGIGKALSYAFAEEGYELGLTARRVELLEQIKQDFPDRIWIQHMDVRQSDEAMQGLDRLIQIMQGVDIVVINAGVGYGNEEHLDWWKEKDTIDVNVLGFAAMCNTAARYFIARKEGHIVGISSIAALRGHSHAPAYNASKAFMSNYMEGIRHLFIRRGLKISVTDVKPGYVDTPMTEGNPGMFWVATPQVAARQIIQAIKRRKRHVYVTRRWGLIAWLIKRIPRWVHDKV